MENEKRSPSLADIRTRYFIFFGGTVGAVLGLMTYVNDWL